MLKTCKCGCGKEIAGHSTWAQGHNAKRGNPEELAALTDPNPSGVCMCGCGTPTKIAKVTSTRDGAVRGFHRQFIAGHGNGKLMIGSARTQWRGGRIVTDEGYIKVRIGDVGERRYILEHRYVMERALGRKLATNEQVHHVNGDKMDNRPENLELWHRSQPNGVRREDYHCPGCRCAV